MKALLILLALLAALTLFGSPSALRWAFSHPKDLPPTPAGWRPKCMIGGQYVTAEQFNERIPA